MSTKTYKIILLAVTSTLFAALPVMVAICWNQISPAPAILITEYTKFLGTVLVGVLSYFAVNLYIRRRDIESSQKQASMARLRYSSEVLRSLQRIGVHMSTLIAAKGTSEISDTTRRALLGSEIAVSRAMLQRLMESLGSDIQFLPEKKETSRLIELQVYLLELDYLVTTTTPLWALGEAAIANLSSFETNLTQISALNVTRE